uniref:Uncharacterized protein n=1 Tax=Nelumbo nucifera TaxID=4432 RepID=A0A822YPD9_NELNU|nr:TPA_asm: hypothetical protein HUJ06_011567 [Nelumbo nucifera]
MNYCCSSYVNSHPHSHPTPWKPFSSSSSPSPPSPSRFFVRFTKNKKESISLPIIGDVNSNSRRLAMIRAAASDNSGDTINNKDTMAAKGSGTTARSRRLLKVKEEKRKREYDRLHNYPSWAKILEDACRNDSELRAVLGDSIGNPEQMRKRLKKGFGRKVEIFASPKRVLSSPSKSASESMHTHVQFTIFLALFFLPIY